MAKPQDLLDELNSLDLQELWKSEVSPKERLAQLKITKQRVKQTKQQLRAEQETIKRRWDGRNKAEARQEYLELLPYTLIEQTISKIDLNLTELAKAIEFSQPLPEKIVFGTVIGGGEEFGGYIIGTPVEVEIYEIESRLNTTKNARLVASNGRTTARAKAVNAQEQIKVLEPEVTTLQIKAKRTLWIHFLEFLTVLAGGIMLCGLLPVGLYLYSSNKNRQNFDFNFMMFGVIVACGAGLVVWFVQIAGLRSQVLANKALVPQRMKLEAARNEYGLMKNKYKVDTQAMTSLDEQVVGMEKRLLELQK